ncbi:MAG: seg [candidate division WS6 bacterium 36_33]|uniref:Seg n=1 Tax=candidate division WS6 bacterium 36_33 TaxID=1641388 RepID=A0A101GZB4_9BACT|nr:MAG: seg [candidate division WS6 bacterium 36_33]
MTSISQIGELLIHWGQDVTLENVIDQRILVAINFFVLFSTLVAVVLIIVAGYGFMTSAGEPEKVKKAQGTLTAAIIGMIIVFLARMIVGFTFDVIQDNVGREPEEEDPPIYRPVTPVPQ